MSIENDFDPMGYSERVMRSKGFDPESNDEYADIFELQRPAWQDLINRHRIGDDLSRSEQLLTTFMQRETFGGATKVIEAFAKHLDAQPKQTGSPDWSKAAQETQVCGWCDGRGVVSDIPVRVERRREVVERNYSFACKCDRGRFFAGMRIAEDWMIQYATDRKTRETAGHKEKLKRYDIDPDASPEKRAEQFRAFIKKMKEQDIARKSGGRREIKAPSGIMQAANEAVAKVKSRTEFEPEVVDDIRQKIMATKARYEGPPEKLNPDRVALAVFANGDDRNEWE
jgi:hypothetical protein